MAEQRTIALTDPSSYSKLYARQVVGNKASETLWLHYEKATHPNTPWPAIAYAQGSSIDYRWQKWLPLKTWCAFIHPSGRSNHYNSEYLKNTETPIINIACTSTGEGKILRQQAQLLLKVTTAGNALALA